MISCQAGNGGLSPRRRVGSHAGRTVLSTARHSSTSYCSSSRLRPCCNKAATKASTCAPDQKPPNDERSLLKENCASIAAQGLLKLGFSGPQLQSRLVCFLRIGN